MDVSVLSARFRRNDSTFNNVFNAQERERRISVAVSQSNVGRHAHMVSSNFLYGFLQPIAGEEKNTNPGRYGKVLVQWLAERLNERGVSVQGVIPEDFGWVTTSDSTRITSTFQPEHYTNFIEKGSIHE